MWNLATLSSYIHTTPIHANMYIFTRHLALVCMRVGLSKCVELCGYIYIYINIHVRDAHTHICARYPHTHMRTTPTHTYIFIYTHDTHTTIYNCIHTFTHSHTCIHARGSEHVCGNVRVLHLVECRTRHISHASNQSVI